jgi:hypothetical protein
VSRGDRGLRGKACGNTRRRRGAGGRNIAERVAEILADRDQPAVEDGWLRGADRIAAYIDAPRSRVYALASARRIPVERDGSSLIARRSDLLRHTTPTIRSPSFPPAAVSPMLTLWTRAGKNAKATPP